MTMHKLNDLLVAGPGVMCATHTETPAAYSKVTEIDYVNKRFCTESLCLECLNGTVADNDNTGMCQWCGEDETNLQDARSADEGSYGRIYSVCPNCANKPEIVLLDNVGTEDSEIENDRNHDDIDDEDSGDDPDPDFDIE